MGRQMRKLFGLIVVVGLFSASANLAARGEQATPPAKMRVGTYDSRAVAVAFVESKTMAAELKDMKQQRDQPKMAGDDAKVAALERRGAEMQRRLNRQGFSGFPVDDILAKVKDQLPKVATDTRLAVIVAKPEFAADGVEVVDVTDDLVKLFDPSEKTLKTIKDLRARPVVAVEELDTEKGK
jgi:hypothetical protein